MASFDFSKFNIFKNLTARSRIMVLAGGVLVMIGLVYLAAKYVGGSGPTVGASNVATVPVGVASVPGGTGLSGEYQRTLQQYNQQTAQTGRMTGSSAIPTQINTGLSSGSPCVICTDKNADVKNLLDSWVMQGKVTPDVADNLKKLASQNVSPEAYAAALQRLVQEGKLTPDQARQLLAEYKKQHANANLAEAEQLMDGLIKSGALPLDAANQLLEAQRRGVSTGDYNGMLQKMVRDGKISAGTAQQLLQQYAKQCVREEMDKYLGMVNKLASDGTITSEVGKRLSELVNQNVAAAEYGSTLDQLLKEGKITPDAARKLLEAYRQSKLVCLGGSDTISQLLQQAENEAFQEISDLLAANKITPDTAAALTAMIQSNVPMDQFKATIVQMVQDKKLTPEIAQLKLADYQKVKQLRDAQAELAELQANNASPEDYANTLKKLVAAGIITPEQAARMMQEYQARLAAAQAGPNVPISSGAFGQLQQRVAQGVGTTAAPTVSPGEFTAAQTAAAQESETDRQARIANLINAMSGQAGQLINAWQPPTMQHHDGSAEKGKEKETAGTTTTATGKAGSTAGTGGAAATGELPVLIKGGTIIFGVLDTAINSDYPDSPIMVTIVQGPLKGAKLLGKIVTTKGVTGQMDRVSLNFTLMNFDPWPKSRAVTAYAIDPDTARTMIASAVDYHYMQRYGAMIATSFLQGYATAVTNQGTSTTGIFGTSTTTPELSPGNKIMVALGQVGQSLGAATQNYINRPPTVRVDSGVSLGILFMSDVS